MVPSESAPQELSNEWSCRYVLTIFNFFVNSQSVLKVLKVKVNWAKSKSQLGLTARNNTKIDITPS
jgi:hypothetical protein